MTCPRPHSKAIAEPRLPGAQIRASSATLAGCPTRPGPEALTSGTGRPSAQSRMHAGGGSAGRNREGGGAVTAHLQTAGGGAGRGGGGKEKEEGLEAVREAGRDRGDRCSWC